MEDKISAVCRSFLEPIVDHPEDIKIVKRIDEMGLLLSIRVHPDDMGQVVGKSGETAKALRHFMRIVGVRDNARVSLKIEEPERSQNP